MVAGGGASVIYADTVADLGYGGELGNYGEYRYLFHLFISLFCQLLLISFVFSGDPSEAETYQYALTLLNFATKHNDGRPKALIIGGMSSLLAFFFSILSFFLFFFIDIFEGAVANFTDVAATFSGIIRAIRV